MNTTTKKLATQRKNPRILICTPEITYLPSGMGNMANTMRIKAGGLADVSASLVSALYELGADVHVALPHYRRMFHVEVGRLINRELMQYKSKLSSDRIHLAEDRLFYYRDHVYDAYSSQNDLKFALAFQREVINNIITRVRPDLIHCNDWMTGLIPAAARRLGIPCLITVHNIHTYELTLERIEDSGIDAAEFWNHLFYKWPTGSYEDTRSTNPVDLLASGIFSAHFINTVSPTFLNEIVDGRHDPIPANIRHEVSQKKQAGCAFGVLNAPDPVYNPMTDEYIPVRYDATSHVEGKRECKRQLQERLGLLQNPDAPLFFWPSRLDPVQKGPSLLSHILYDVVSRYSAEELQIVFVANGVFQRHFHDIVRMHGLEERVAVCDFDESLSCHGYAASDFMLMPSRFEPCGLPQMISTLYGSLPIVHDTGGLHDTVQPLDVAKDSGTGFVFAIHDATGLSWAIDRAMDFYHLPADIRARQIARIMRYGLDTFNHKVTARHYFDMYESMTDRPLINPY